MNSKLVRIGNVPVHVYWDVYFGVPLLYEITNMCDQSVMRYLKPRQLERIFNFVLSSENSNV